MIYSLNYIKKYLNDSRWKYSPLLLQLEWYYAIINNVRESAKLPFSKQRCHCHNLTWCKVSCFLVIMQVIYSETPHIGDQSIRGLTHVETNNHSCREQRGNLKSAINLSGGAQMKPTQAQWEHANSTLRDPGRTRVWMQNPLPVRGKHWPLHPPATLITYLEAYSCIFV